MTVAIKDTCPIKVCFIAPKAYPIFNPAIREVFGGAQLDLYLLATELAKDSAFAVSFITADYGQKLVEVIENVRVIKSFKFRHNSVSATWRLLKAMWIIDADIYFLKASAAGAFLIAAYAKLRGRTFIYRTASQGECDGTYIKQHLFAGMLFKWAMKWARYVLVQNETDGINIKRTMGITSIHIPNGHRITNTSTVAKDCILWVGRSAKVKRPELFIKLARQFPSEHFVMICQKNIDDTEYSSLVTAAAAVQNLEFLKHVPFEQVNNYFLRAKVLVNTSDSEGFPNTFIQAGVGKVAILSLNVNPDGFLDKYGCGKFSKGDWQNFTDMLAQLLVPATAAEYCANTRRYVEEKHNITVLIKEYKELIKGI